MKAKYITPCITALKENGSLDLDGQNKLYDYLINGGIDGVLILGSIGEFFSMRIEQRKELVESSIRHIHGRMRTIVGTASMDFEEAVGLSNHALSVGADAVAVISPYYVDLSDEAVILYYTELSKRVTGSLYLYNYPDRTGYHMTPAAVLEISRQCPNVIGIKDSVSNVEHTLAIIEAVKPERPDFEVYCGFDKYMPQIVRAGGNGAIGGLSNVCPALMHDWVQSLNSGDGAKERTLSAKVDQLMALYGIAKPFIPQIKEAVRLQGVPITHCCTFPIVPSSREISMQILELLHEVIPKEN